MGERQRMELSMGTLTIRWIGQNGYLLRDGETEICIDPYLSNVVDRVAKRGRMVQAPFSPEDLKSDVTLCTHNHLDHVDIDTIPLMKMVDFCALICRQNLLTLRSRNCFKSGGLHCPLGAFHTQSL